MFIPGERRLQGVPSDSLQIPTGALHGEWSQAFHSGARWEGKTQQAESFTLGIKKNLFTPRTIKQWIGFPREVVQSPSLQVFKTRQQPSLYYSWLSFEQKVGLDTS